MRKSLLRMPYPRTTDSKGAGPPAVSACSLTEAGPLWLPPSLLPQVETYHIILQCPDRPFSHQYMHNMHIVSACSAALLRCTAPPMPFGAGGWVKRKKEETEVGASVRFPRGPLQASTKFEFTAKRQYQVRSYRLAVVACSNPYERSLSLGLQL